MRSAFLTPEIIRHRMSKVGSSECISYSLMCARIMQFKIFLQDLNEETIAQIKWVLRHDLADEIDEAAGRGMDRDLAEEEIISDYLNRHNVGIPAEI